MAVSWTIIHYFNAPAGLTIATAILEGGGRNTKDKELS
jgi:hypothetical protein